MDAHFILSSSASVALLSAGLEDTVTKGLPGGATLQTVLNDCPEHFTRHLLAFIEKAGVGFNVCLFSK